MTRSFLGSFAAIAFLVFVVIGTAVSVTAQTNFYTDRSAFEADFPGLTVEDFEEARFPAGPVTLCEEPINSLSNDDCFIPGEIIPGVDFFVERCGRHGGPRCGLVRKCLEINWAKFLPR